MGAMGVLHRFTHGNSGLVVTVFATEKEVASAAVVRLRSVVLDCPEAHLGLATGATFAPVFSEMASVTPPLDLSAATFWHLDEYLEAGGHAEGSMFRELRERLLDKLPVAPRRFVAMREFLAEADPAAACEKALQSAPPLSLQFLGLGQNGHLAFNEPGTPFSSATHLARLTESTRTANASRFPNGVTPDRALTMGPRTILRAQRLLLLATGAKKNAALRQLLLGPIDESCPATLIRLHPRAEVFVDAAAFAGLPSTGWQKPSLPLEIFDEWSLRPPGPVVVISPHPDDASISCGGLLASLPKSAPKHIITMTTGARALVPGTSDAHLVAALREDEVRREAEHLGAGTSFLRGRFYDSAAFESADAIALARLLESLQPGWILAPSLDDPHPTHRLSRQILDDALGRWSNRRPGSLVVWTFEGPWFQHPRDRINALVVYSAAAEAVKLRAVRQHVSQLARVPFDEGAAALARLRGIGFSESHFGGKEPGRMQGVPLVEAYVREVV